MGSCLVVQVTLSTDNERKGGSVKNNIVLPEISNTFSKEEEKEEMNVEEELDSLLNSENHSTTPVNKRRLSTISNLTMDEAILYLDKQKETPRLARRVSIIMYNDNVIKEEDEVKLMREMILSYLQVMKHDKNKMNSLLLQLYHLESEGRQTPTASVTPRFNHRRQRRRSSVLGGIKEEFRQAVLTRDDMSTSVGSENN
eukprot:gene5992-6440_t